MHLHLAASMLFPPGRLLSLLLPLLYCTGKGSWAAGQSGPEVMVYNCVSAAGCTSTAAAADTALPLDGGRRRLRAGLPNAAGRPMAAIHEASISGRLSLCLALASQSSQPGSPSSAAPATQEREPARSAPLAHIVLAPMVPPCSAQAVGLRRDRTDLPD